MLLLNRFSETIPIAKNTNLHFAIGGSMFQAATISCSLIHQQPFLSPAPHLSSPGSQEAVVPVGAVPQQGHISRFRALPQGIRLSVVLHISAAD